MARVTTLFRAIVNNVPILTSSLAQGLGMSAENAQRLGGALGIASVAVNIWIKNWEHAKAVFGGDWSTSVSKGFQNITDSIISATTRLLNFERGLSGVALTAEGIARNQRGLEQRAAQKDAQERAIQGNEGAVGGAHGQTQEEQARYFREALTKFGGGEKLRDSLLAGTEDQAMANARRRVEAARAKGDNSLNIDTEREKEQARFRNAANEQIAAAMRGDSGAIARLTGGNDQLGRHFENARQGIDQEAIERQGIEHERQFRQRDVEKTREQNELGRQNELEMNEQRAADRNRETDRFASQLSPRVSKSLLLNENTSQESVESQVSAALKRAGVDAQNSAEEFGKIVKDTAAKIRRRTEDAVRERSAATGLTTAQTRSVMLAEEHKRERDERERLAHLGAKAEVSTRESFLDKLVLAGLHPKEDEIPAEQLETMKTQVGLAEKMVALLEKGDPKAKVAVFGRRN